MRRVRKRERGESRALSPRALVLARLALLWEALWPASWPALGIAGLFMALAFAGFVSLLPGWLHLGLLVIFASALCVAVYRLARALRLPGRTAGKRRIERDSALEHRPLAALEDRLAVGAGDAMSEALWRAHLARMRGVLGRIRIALPRPGLPGRDPRALRLLIVLLLAVGLVAAGEEAPHRLMTALMPELGAVAGRNPATVELWLTPPAYTGLAPIFLRAPTGDAAKEEGSAPARLVKVPVESKVLARVEGGAGVPRLVLGEKTEPFKPVDETTYQLEDTLVAGDRLAVQQGGRTIGQWAIAIVPDLPPTIAFAAPPSRTLRSALRLEYTASDDYGLADAKAEIRRAGARPDEAPVELELPLSTGHPKQAHETSFSDLTPHPWAGLPVTIQLFAQDEAGQVGKSERVDMVLPERIFNHPVARAIIAERKTLTRDPSKRMEVAAGLTAIASQPEAFGHEVSVFLALISARSRLRLSGTAETVGTVQQLLWETALAVEDGHLSLAERELRELQQRLQDALERGASEQEIEQLMAQLEQAIDRYLAALLEQQQRNPDLNQQPLDQNAQVLQLQDLHKLLDQMREMARTGAHDAARQLLARLRDMLENMRTARLNPGGQGRSGATGLMRGMDELIGQQDRLLQRTFREAQQGIQGMPLERPGSGGSATEQEALRRALGELMRRLGEMAGQIPGALGQAERAMRDAVGAFNRDALGDALDAQSRALDLLRQGRQAMLEGLRQQLGREGDPDMLDAFGPVRDPLGRVAPGFGSIDSNDVTIPEHGAIQRAREIQDELQRRAGERRRPEIELEYIDRLLKRF